MQAWDKFLEQQEKETVAKWLRSLKILRFDACNLYLEAKDAFQTMWFEEHLRKKVNEQLLNNNRKKIKVHLVTPNSTPAPRKPSTKPKQVEKPASPKFTLNFDSLDPQCTFKTYMSTEENELTYTDASVAALAEKCHNNLTKLNLSECGQVTDASVAALAEKCSNLTKLNLTECTGVTKTLVQSLRMKHPDLRIVCELGDV